MATNQVVGGSTLSGDAAHRRAIFIFKIKMLCENTNKARSFRLAIGSNLVLLKDNPYKRGAKKYSSFLAPGFPE